MSFPKFVNMPKNTPFFPMLHVFAPLNDVRAYIACRDCLVLKNNPNYVIFFFTRMISSLKYKWPPGLFIYLSIYLFIYLFICLVFAYFVCVSAQIQCLQYTFTLYITFTTPRQGIGQSSLLIMLICNSRLWIELCQPFFTSFCNLQTEIQGG